MDRRLFLKGGLLPVAAALPAIAGAADSVISLRVPGWYWTAEKESGSHWWTVYGRCLWQGRGERYGWKVSEEYIADRFTTVRAFMLDQISKIEYMREFRARGGI